MMMTLFLPKSQGTESHNNKNMRESVCSVVWFVVSKMCTSKKKQKNKTKQRHWKFQNKIYMDERVAGAHFEGTYKNKSYDSPNARPHCTTLSLHSSEAVAVRFVAVGLGVVQCLHLLLGGPLVSGLLFPDQVSAVVEQVSRQQEATQ